MTSAVLDGQEAAAKSASQNQLAKNGKKKQRGRYSEPVRPAHLSDRSAIAADQRLDNQFFQSGRSITPPPGAEGWALKGRMMVTVDATETLSRMSRPKRTTNRDSTNTAPVKVSMLTSHGGDAMRSEIVRHMLRTGMYDEEVKEHYRTLMAAEATADGAAAATAPARRVSAEIVNSAEEMAAIHTKRKSDREVAEKPVSIDQAAVGGGVVSEEVTAEDIERELDGFLC
jgi:hypothetical protein